MVDEPSAVPVEVNSRHQRQTEENRLRQERVMKARQARIEAQDQEEKLRMVQEIGKKKMECAQESSSR